MRKDVQCGFIGPPGFQVICLVLWKSAIVEDAELRLVGRIRQRIGFAAIVEACPVEQSGAPRTLGIELPAALDDILNMMVGRVTVHADHTPGIVRTVEVPAARAAARRLFTAHNLPRRIPLLAVVHVVLHDIVKADHINTFDQFHTAGIGHGTGTCGIIEACIFAHGLGQASALNRVLKTPLLVSVAP